MCFLSSAGQKDVLQDGDKPNLYQHCRMGVERTFWDKGKM